MLRLFNTLTKRIEEFRPVNDRVATVFTCGPSVYQRSHIGNLRTFLFEDILVRYLEYSGYAVKRGMNFTNLEDKAIREAKERNTTLEHLTEENIRVFMQEMKLLHLKVPDYLPKASEAVDEAVGLIQRLLERGVAYRHGRNIYFDPLKYPDFGRLYGLDMTKWPAGKRRYHRDTYPGIQWNLGDFILWHGCKEGDVVCWDTPIGKGRPSWNIQDPSMISKHYDEPLSVYCGGFDNLFRHHDYTRAILESVRPYPAARYWLHGRHLLARGKKMSKSRGNIYYVDTLLAQGFQPPEIRFFLIYGHYREELDFSWENLKRAAQRLREFKERVRRIDERARGLPPPADGGIAQRLRQAFTEKMDNDLDVRGAFDALDQGLAELDTEGIAPEEASAILKTLRRTDEVLHVIFDSWVHSLTQGRKA